MVRNRRYVLDRNGRIANLLLPEGAASELRPFR